MTMRKLIGILGMALGFAVVFGGVIFGNGGIERSFSAYYLTNMRDLFVGVLFITGAFLLSYKGYDFHDNLITSLSGIMAIGIAIFPVEATIPNNIFNFNTTWASALHTITSVSFFLLLSYMSYFRFTKGSSDTKIKKTRNIIYKASALVMAVNLVFGGAYMFLGLFPDSPYFITIIEIIMLNAFGVSWLVKGQAILKD
jgi:hypothetical protein